MNAEGLRRIVQNLVTNFTSFVPLGTVLVALLGVGVAERSGLLTALIRSMVLKANPRTVTVVIVFAGVLSNTASEMGYVVLIPLAATVFFSLGRHPLAGLAAAFAGVSGGYSANLLLGTVDPLLAGITQEAARLIDPTYTVDASANWFFMFASTFLVTVIASIVSLKIVEPTLGEYDSTQANLDDEDSHRLDPLTATERRGLKFAGVAALIMAIGIALLVVPEGAVLRNPETGEIRNSPFLRGIVALIFVFFLVPGFVYGRVVGTMRSDRDVIDAMANAMSTLGLYIVLVFFAAQFVKFFSWTNLGAVTAVTGATFLENVGFTGPAIFFFFILPILRGGGRRRRHSDEPFLENRSVGMAGAGVQRCDRRFHFAAAAADGSRTVDGNHGRNSQGQGCGPGHRSESLDGRCFGRHRAGAGHALCLPAVAAGVSGQKAARKRGRSADHDSAPGHRYRPAVQDRATAGDSGPRQDAAAGAVARGGGRGRPVPCPGG